jgi:predicted membrane protein
MYYSAILIINIEVKTGRLIRLPWLDKKNFYFKMTIKMRDADYRPYSRTHIIVGAVVITIGIVMLMKNFGVIPFWVQDFFFRWQFILILIGTIAFFTNSNKVPGLVIMFIGIFFLAPEYFKEFQNYFIPVALIMVGLAIMLRRRRSKRSFFEINEYSSNDPDIIDIVAVFSGGERQVTSKNFKGGEITTVFGGVEVNFLNTRIAPQEVHIEVTAVFGGLVLIIPSDWEVVIDVDQVFGGFADKRYFPPDHKSDPSKRIVIKGAVVFGGGEIKNHK